jgi:hypothetical protein
LLSRICDEWRRIFSRYQQRADVSGLGVSFSTLQDTTKTQNSISKRVFENPKYAQRFIVTVALMVAFFVGIGLFGTLISNNPILNELAIGCLGLGIGMLGMLKSIIEMAEYHRKP